jgi:hypothetical protein
VAITGRFKQETRKPGFSGLHGFTLKYFNYVHNIDQFQKYCGLKSPTYRKNWGAVFLKPLWSEANAPMVR